MKHTVITLLLALAGCAAKPGLAFTQLDYPMATQTVQVGTAQIAYHDVGKGERTLVLIHGLGSYMPAWSRNVEALAKDHRVVVIDLPGYGKSTKANYDYSMRFFAKAVRGVVRQLGLQRVVLVGHSMGGQIAMTYALDYPEELEALVLTAPAGLERFKDGEARWLAQMTTPEFTCTADDEAIFVRHSQNFYKMPREAEFMVRDRIAVRGGPDFQSYCVAISRSVAGMLDQPVADRLREIDVPTLVLFGDADALIPNPFLHGGSTVRMAKKSVAELPDAELVVLEKAGHMAQFEQAHEWNRHVLSFLAAHGDAPKAGRVHERAAAKPGSTVEPLYAPGTDPDDEEKATPAPAKVEPPPAKVEPVPPVDEPQIDPEPPVTPAAPADDDEPAVAAPPPSRSRT